MVSGYLYILSMLTINYTQFSFPQNYYINHNKFKYFQNKQKKKQMQRKFFERPPNFKLSV